MFVPISNCVTSSSPTTGLRTIHLLRSILFLALPSHAIPANPMLCLHLYFNIKLGKPQVRAKLRCHAVAACFTNAAEIPCGFHVAGRSLSLTQFNLPVVMSMMKHSWLLSVQTRLLNNIPLSVCLHWQDFCCLSLWFLHFSELCRWALYSYLFTQHSSGYELHSGILYATYAALCRSGPIIT